ncbi:MULTISPECIES: TetR/AcrR family transcriptional regulator [unclassified Mycolicibacterium]|uniref:TetR/AcrR family transcriptional regulator n=1 Tax=unclassified Mycolicibacterium TaxID=2636767 RepID=UPI0012DEE67A|nr:MULTISPECIES: TetR/AcrR family transcriptional regulator [unclassified Mycolicibacterium]MUL83325.1 TetR/AcrR family transcriptional regulator [Mycolicibacterium sp. CBMA 329]MUL90316.1 TetR/AcrR family transcriptional regulator [Mycolicibacterium sp. CBMA 331]MUM00290.1 TetR/AcrR family transcriptional regulator [Mycolicibacterium sp. CBMA 334]MUM26505.1 TetR/AcrR family transcriptional regulator [Mycolicibacterium sp. CBMA 295]MUM41260.1 TetR/AcrR family transcriptional regulator [Mycolic
MPNTDTKRSRAEHLGPERRRPQVLDAALQIAAADGVGGVTMGAIAARLGVTRPVVYACYPGRGDVLAALLQRETDRVLADMSAILPPPRTGSIEQLFIDGFRELLTAVQQQPAPWRIMLAADLDPVLSAAISRGRAQLGGQVATVMRPLLVRRQVKNVDHVLAPLAEVFLAISEAAIRMLLDDDQHWTPANLAAVMGPSAYRALRVG